VPRRRRLSPADPLPRLVDAWLFQLGTRKPSERTLTAYRADIDGVARRIDSDGAAVLHLEDLTKPALRAGFASWAADHATASILRAHSAWTAMFDFLVAEDLIEGNPMAAITKPKPSKSAPRAIKADDAAARLLTTAATLDPAARDPWPERDLALVALFLVSGIREGEAVTLNMASSPDQPVPDASSVGVHVIPQLDASAFELSRSWSFTFSRTS